MEKIAIVLGTSSGMGLAAAESLLARGFTVYGGSRSESSIEHENFVDIEFDITQKKEIQNFIAEVKKDTDVIDVLVNAIGMCELGSIEDATEMDLRAHLETNVIGLYSFLKEFESMILSDETHIINLFSISAKKSFANTVSYTSSEHAKKSMLAVFEKEWMKYQVRFTNFFIGAVNTPLWDEYPEVEVDKMLTTRDFIYMFEHVLNAPPHMKFPDLTFLHRDGFID